MLSQDTINTASGFSICVFPLLDDHVPQLATIFKHAKECFTTFNLSCNG